MSESSTQNVTIPLGRKDIPGPGKFFFQIFVFN